MRMGRGRLLASPSLRRNQPPCLTESAMLTSYFNFLLQLLRISCPVLLFAIPLAMTAGALVPWASADALLKQHYGERSVTVGASYRGSSLQTETGWKTSVYRERRYILIPSALHDPKVVVISQDNDQPVQLSEDSGGALMLPLAFALFGFGTWWFWLRPRKAA